MKAERLHKIANLALAPSAAQGEWQAAAIAFFATLRAEGCTTLPGQGAPPPPGPTAWDYSPIMPFGKFKGRSVQWISEVEPEYLEWVLENCHRISQALRRAIESSLQKTNR